jgi:hypothetical protein
MNYKSIAGPCFLLAAGCAHAGQVKPALPRICASAEEAGRNIDRVDVLVTSDQHGSTATIKACPDRAFSVDFTESELFSQPYSALLDKIQLQSMQGGSPIEMQISGVLSKKTGNEIRDKIIVHKIVKYTLN